MLDENDLKIIKSCNRYQLDVEAGEYHLIKRDLKDKSPVNVMENLLVTRAERAFESGNISDLSVMAYGFSIVAFSYNEEVAFKWRKYSVVFKHMSMLLSSKLIWKVSYVGDKRCDGCQYLANCSLSLEQETINPSLPFRDCKITPLKLCTAQPAYKVVRDENGRLLSHDKDYSQMLKFKVFKDTTE